MFTGIIEGMGTITGVRPAGEAKAIAVTADFELEATRIGDSIAVNGACLTVTALEGRRFTADVSPETLSRTTFAAVKTGERVNLERALRLSDRLDGHLVSGHVDGLAELKSSERAANAIILRFSAPPELTRYMITKGSVAVDGISLTINGCDDEGFTVSIIPHTAKLTTIGLKGVGARFNIETDLIGKYVERFLQRGQKPAPAKASGIDMEFLARSGFLDR
ncbi:MAG: riboflavin synthase [Desulfobacteraceae bacterium]|nr:riboflavin synthase [Desulfobacteraceae bacterium]